MTFDLRGTLKNNRPANSLYQPIHELVSNAIDSCLIAIDRNLSSTIDIRINIDGAHELNHSLKEFSIKCTDNGAGFGASERKAFLTPNTSFKDDLKISGITACKGTGRFQYFHFFQNVNLNSNFSESDQPLSASANFHSDAVEYDDSAFKLKNNPREEKALVTSIELSNAKAELISEINKSPEQRAISVETIRKELFRYFFMRLTHINLQKIQFSILVNSNISDEVEESITNENIPNPLDDFSIELNYEDLTEDFSIAVYRTSETASAINNHSVTMCAKNSPVEDITKHFLFSKGAQLVAIDGFYYTIFISSPYLDGQVKDQRDGFKFQKYPSKSTSLFGPELSEEEIVEQIRPYLETYLVSGNWSKEKIIESAAVDYGLSEKMINEYTQRITHGETSKHLAKRVLSNLQDEVLEDTAELIDARNELASLDPLSDEFAKKLDKIAWKRNVKIDALNQSVLSQLVIRRVLIVELLKTTVKERLLVQTTKTEKEKKRNEALIHSLFFPMQKSTMEKPLAHDIWMLNEEYQYYNFISSDQSLSSIILPDGSTLFEASIDKEVETQYSTQDADSSTRRPDIALFSQEEALVIIEFKAPGVELAGKDSEIVRYASLLRSKSRGKIKRIYGYLIGDTIDVRAIGMSAKTGNDGFFTTKPLSNNFGMQIGSVYIETMTYDHVIRAAETRIRIYQEKLGFSI